MDTILVLEDGTLIQSGTLKEVYPTAVGMTEAEDPTLKPGTPSVIPQAGVNPSADDMVPVVGTVSCRSCGFRR